jgi:poly(3-hydroxyalkanoate) synthetase
MGERLMDTKDNKKESWWKRFLKWIEKASKKEPPKCGGNCC